MMSSQLIISIRTKGRVLTKNVVQSFRKTAIYCATDIPNRVHLRIFASVGKNFIYLFIYFY